VDVVVAIGRLCVAGDRACERGDLDGLGEIARCVAELARGEPQHCTLARLADTCRCDARCAVAAWIRIKHEVLG
jgi:hypothetical protein